MDSTRFDGFDHEAHMTRAIELARNAAERGDRPFGSVLVRDNERLIEESNRVITENDIRRHPELHLAHRAARGYDPIERGRMVMYTSTEPCSMCAGGIRRAGLGHVVYSVSSDEFAEFAGRVPTISSTSILGDATEVVGPVLNEEGRAVHEEYNW